MKINKGDIVIIKSKYFDPHNDLEGVVVEDPEDGKCVINFEDGKGEMVYDLIDIKKKHSKFDYDSRDIETTGMSKNKIVTQLDDHIDKKAIELSRTNLHKYAACKEMAIYVLENISQSHLI